MLCNNRGYEYAEDINRYYICLRKSYPPYLLYEYLISKTGRYALELIQTGTTIRVLGSRNLEQLTVTQYDKDFADKIGGSLKAAFIEYRQSLFETEKKYKNQREKLLNRIKEKGEA